MNRRGALILAAALAACEGEVRSTGPTLRDLYAVPATTSLDPRSTALLLVDFQEEFFHGRLVLPEGPRAAERAAELLAWARRAGVMVVHVRNETTPGAALFAPGSPTLAFEPRVAPEDGEPIVTKRTGGGFTRTELDATLKARGVRTVIVAGLMTHLAVAMTAQDGAVLGYRVIVAADATATRDLPGAADERPVTHDELARAALAAIADRFGEVLLARDRRGHVESCPQRRFELGPQYRDQLRGRQRTDHRRALTGPLRAVARLAGRPGGGVQRLAGVVGDRVVRDRRLAWANLLARVFAVDVTICRKCGGRMRVVDIVTDPDDIARILV